MSAAADPHSLVHDALAVLTGFGFLGLFACLLAGAFWLRFDVPIWSAL